MDGEENDMEIKPCPFCGGKAIVEDCGTCGDTGRYFVRCSKCDISQDALWATKQTAVKRWNKRIEVREILEEIIEEQTEINTDDSQSKPTAEILVRPTAISSTEVPWWMKGK